MRRTARALAAAVLTGAALGGPTAAVGAVPAVDKAVEQALDQGADPPVDPPVDPPRIPAPDQGGHPPVDPPAGPSKSPAPSEGANPAAEVSPATVHPGGSVTVSVSCGPVRKPAPETVEATSDAFVDGVAELRRVPGADHAGGPVYRGTARVAPAAEPDAGAGPGSARTVDGTCPARPGGEGGPWSAAFTVKPGGGTPTAPPDGHHPCPRPHAPSCGDTVIPGGVRAGRGGAFTDSVPALAAGGVCIAAALGGAVYRLRRRRPVTEGREGRGGGPVD